MFSFAPKCSVLCTFSSRFLYLCLNHLYTHKTHQNTLNLRKLQQFKMENVIYEWVYCSLIRCSYPTRVSKGQRQGLLLIIREERTWAFERVVPKHSHLQSLFFLKALQRNSNLRCKSERLIMRHIHSHFAYLHFAFSSLFLWCINKMGMMIHLLELCCLRTTNCLSFGVWWVSNILTHISHFSS